MTDEMKITRQFDVSDMLAEVCPNFRGILVLFCDKQGGHILETYGDHAYVVEKARKILTTDTQEK